MTLVAVWCKTGYAFPRAESNLCTALEICAQEIICSPSERSLLLFWDTYLLLDCPPLSLLTPPFAFLSTVHSDSEPRIGLGQLGDNFLSLLSWRLLIKGTSKHLIVISPIRHWSLVAVSKSDFLAIFSPILNRPNLTKAQNRCASLLPPVPIWRATDRDKSVEG